MSFFLYIKYPKVSLALGEALHVAIFGHSDGQRPLNSSEDLIGLTCVGTTTCGTTSRRLATTRKSDQQAPNGTPKSDGAQSVHEADSTVLTDTTWLFNFAHRRHLFSLAVYLQETRVIYVHNRRQKSPTEECVILTICNSQANWKNRIIDRKNLLRIQIKGVTGRAKTAPSGYANSPSSTGRPQGGVSTVRMTHGNVASAYHLNPQNAVYPSPSHSRVFMRAGSRNN